MGIFTRKIVYCGIVVLMTASFLPATASAYSRQEANIFAADSTNASIPRRYRYRNPMQSQTNSEKFDLILPENKEQNRPKRRPIGHSRKKVGLVLSGGGAKGVAHIGVIKVLEEAGIPIDYIAGTSMGAIVGGLYSIGWTTKELDSMVRQQNWLALLSDRVARKDKLLSEKEIADTYIVSVPLSFNKKFSMPSGVVAGQNVLNLLNEMTIGYHDDNLLFDSLPIPFACVAYDMAKGQEVVFHKGNLPIAIRASMSIPGAFEPVIMDSMVLVDGGIYNNFPVDVVRKMGADIVIGVDLASGPLNLTDINSITGLLSQVSTIMGRDKYNKNIKDVDLYLKPDIKPYNTSSFSAEAVDSLLVRGERCGRQHWDKILEIQDKVYVEDEYMHRQERILTKDTDSIQIGPIKFIGLTKNEEVFTRRALGISGNAMSTKGGLNDAISKLRGSGAFSYVTYTLDSKPPYTLMISVDEKQNAMINVGFRFDSHEMAAILLNTTLSMRGIQGPKLGLTIRLNENPYLKLNFSSRSMMLGRLNVSYMLLQNNYGLYKGVTKINNIECLQNKVDIFFTDSNPIRFNPTIGISYEHYNYNSFLFASETDQVTVKPEGFVNYYLKGYLETFNDHYFPTKGVSMNAKIALHTDNFYSYQKSSPFASIGYNFTWAISATDRLTFMPEINGRTLIGGKIAYSYLNYIGGQIAGRYVEQQIPFMGIKRLEPALRSIMTFALEGRVRLFMRHYISAKVAYGIQNDDFFQMFVNRHDIFGAGIKYSYDSPIGPISLLLDMSNIDKSLGVYFSLGKTF